MLVTLQIMPTAKMNATIFASALKSSSCCINIVFGFGSKSKSDATIPDVVGYRSPSFAIIGYGIMSVIGKNLYLCRRIFERCMPEYSS